MKKTIAVLIMFVHAVAAGELARDMILAPNVGTTANKTAKIIDSGAKINEQNQQNLKIH